MKWKIFSKFTYETLNLEMLKKERQVLKKFKLKGCSHETNIISF